jgi:hypothetical protein
VKVLCLIVVLSALTTPALAYDCDTIRWAAKTFPKEVLDAHIKSASEAEKIEGRKCFPSPKLRRGKSR